jgi:hypothetical protein
MDPKGKGMVINDKEKETLYVDEPKGDMPTDSGSNNKRKDGKQKMLIKKIIYYDNDASSSSPRDDDDEDSSSKKKTVNQNYSFDYSRMLIYYPFHLVNPLTLMEKPILFGAIKCIFIYFLSILVFGKLWKTECNLTVVTIMY